MSTKLKAAWMCFGLFLGAFALGCGSQPTPGASEAEKAKLNKQMEDDMKNMQLPQALPPPK